MENRSIILAIFSTQLFYLKERALVAHDVVKSEALKQICYEIGAEAYDLMKTAVLLEDNIERIKHIDNSVRAVLSVQLRVLSRCMDRLYNGDKDLLEFSKTLQTKIEDWQCKLEGLEHAEGEDH